ncbi:MAG: hypothetical protein UR53_C0002G0069 [Candidatus Magasanikbacteria bacterium GW2011_GWC2_34_16]|uniref:Uncharacterized protein n=2 Tax=Candidatus Magasanikiibacteriota TaxID=1752731 RepID=A0A0G0JUY0_9BACT|nr:MAG: hypothetical protein UR53_C0002G0069 [Candidatus Magasanikbacteria bacterium GW2011_GWC2_34_16]KKQ40714.1 MAG: hypothetical protein US58_C0013G0014 [Candidatus Magasanikbacteria bacterium GW2011_GWA2_37_8]
MALNIYHKISKPEGEPMINHLSAEAEKKSGNNKIKPVNFVNYVDPSGDFTSKELKWGIWYVKNKVLLYRIAVGTLIGLITIFWGFSLWQWGDYLIFGITADQKLYQNLSQTYDYTSIHAHYSPKPFAVSNPELLPGGVGKTDVLVWIENPNPRHVVYFDYYFISGEESTHLRRGVVLAGENKPFVAFGLSDSVASGASIVIENIAWKRISNHTILDVPTWQSERLDFVASDFVFTRPLTKEEASANVVQFKLTNNNPFGYVAAKFVVELLQNGNLVGVLPLELDNFRSLETRDIDLRSFVPNLSVTDLKIYPLLDIYDPTVFLPPEK